MKLNVLLKEALNHDADSIIKQSMLYSTLAPSKHLRASLIEAIVIDYEKEATLAHTAATALEMIQTYSLIHDDLPAMDDDDMRRNQLSNHKKFDEATAILSGDALLTKAFEHVVDSEYSDHVKLSIIKELSYACGLSGMILGQSMDMNPSVINTNNDILKMYTLKTGMLFGAACAIGAILCDLGDRVDNYRSLGQALGVAFQVQDDLLEDEKTAEELGKSKSDAKNKKINLVTLSGKEEAMYIAKNAFEDSLESLKTYQDHKHVVALITKIQNRGH
jgi:geranylgeranyl diphosphate synthase type II